MDAVYVRLSEPGLSLTVRVQISWTWLESFLSVQLLLHYIQLQFYFLGFYTLNMKSLWNMMVCWKLKLPNN